jgi:hypothetical protein
VTVGVYPGSFDPLTIAHLTIAHCAAEQLGLTRVDLAISRRTLGKEHLGAHTVEERVAAIRAAAESRPWLGVVVVDASLVVEIARGYDAVVMGADKWAQVLDPSWYPDGVTGRDAALASLPRVAVAPRHGVDLSTGAHPDMAVLRVPAHIGEISATAVRSGRDEWRAIPQDDDGGGG